MAETVAPRQLSDLFATLDAWQDPVPLDILETELRKTVFTLKDVQRHVHFGDRTYKRNLMHEGPCYHALVLCWRAGQRSPIHDHKGSSCAVRVLSGTAVETTFSRTAAGLIFATRSRESTEDSIVGSFDADIHQISNLQPPGNDLVTLHLYSPPLISMNLYSLTDTRVELFHDPIEFFDQGAGI